MDGTSFCYLFMAGTCQKLKTHHNHYSYSLVRRYPKCRPGYRNPISVVQEFKKKMHIFNSLIRWETVHLLLSFIFIAKFIKTPWFFLAPEVRPRWRYAPVTDMYSYIPGLRPEPPPPAKQFTVHLHCILAASMSNLTTPRPAPVRTRSVSPRPTYSRKSFSPSPKSTPRSSGNFEARRPKSAIGLPSEFARKSLMPSQANASLRPSKKRAGSDKPVAIRPIRPKAGSNTPVAIRGGPKTTEQKMIPFQTSSPENSDSDDIEGRHGYYVYIYNENLNKSQGHVEGKPTASVRPMMFSPEEKDLDSNDFTDPMAKLDLKPMMLNLSPADSLETVQA